VTATVDLQQLERELQNPVMRATGWTAHCGCSHEAGKGTLTKCPPHAAGQRFVTVEV